MSKQEHRCSETTQLPIVIESGVVVYRDRNQTISKVVARFEGFSKEYYVSDHGERAAMVAVRNGEILLVRQYRLLINGLSYEIPGGKVDEGEAPERAAVRECLEEAGIRCGAPALLVSFHASLDIWKNYTYVFYSEQCSEVTPRDGDLRVWMPLPRCMEMVTTHQIADSLTITALLAYQRLVSQRQAGS